MAPEIERWKDECYGEELREKILEFAEGGWESIPEDERRKWFSLFKHWGVFHQRNGQESYFMMRLQNAGGVLRPGQLRAIGEVARDYATGPVENPEFGNGFIDLTTRQSIQLHWLKLEDVPEIWEKLESVGVSSRSSGGDSMRNMAGCPVAGRDKEEFIDSRDLLERLNTDLREDDSLADRPRTFNVSVTGCREGCAQDSINDIGLEPAEKPIEGDSTKGYTCGSVAGWAVASHARPARSTCSSPPRRLTTWCAGSSNSTRSTASARTARSPGRASSSTTGGSSGSARPSRRSTSASNSAKRAQTSARGTRTTPEPVVAATTSAFTNSTTETTTSA